MEPGVEDFLLELTQLVDEVEAAVGSEALGTARRKLRELDATSAMDALKLLDVTTKSCDEADPNRGSMRAAERMLRDVVVMFFVNRGGATAAGARCVFLKTADAKRNFCWLIINSRNFVETFGLDMEPPRRSKIG